MEARSQSASVEYDSAEPAIISGRRAMTLLENAEVAGDSGPLLFLSTTYASTLQSRLSVRVRELRQDSPGRVEVNGRVPKVERKTEGGARCVRPQTRVVASGLMTRTGMTGPSGSQATAFHVFSK